jgi:hypothetical protein
MVLASIEFEHVGRNMYSAHWPPVIASEWAPVGK